jgi:hypothetical protein
MNFMVSPRLREGIIPEEEEGLDLAPTMGFVLPI